MTTPAGRDAAVPVERMVAAFEADATPMPRADGDDRAVDYALRITRVRDASVLTDRAAHAPSSGLEVADTFAMLVTATGEHSITLQRVEILQGFDFDVANGRVTGMLLFDRAVPAASPMVSPSPDVSTPLEVAEPPRLAAVEEGRVSVTAAEGVHQHYEALLSWTRASTDLDAHGFHFKRSGASSHVWHRHRPLGPVFWHYGPSTPDALDERMAITSAPVDGLILYAVHSPVDTAVSPVRAIADSGAAVRLQLPNARQSMHFDAPERDGNLWIPFALLDGRLITTDVVTTVRGVPDEPMLRGLLGDLFASIPLPTPVSPVASVVTDVPVEPLWVSQRPAFGLGALAIALTILVSVVRGAGRGAIMAIVSLVVVALVVQARLQRRR